MNINYIRIFRELLASKKRFILLTVLLFSVYVISFLIFDYLVVNEQRYFLFAFGLVVSSLFFSWLLGGKATFIYVTFFNLFFTFIYSKPMFPKGTLYPRLFLSRSFLFISSCFILLMIFMILKKSPADEVREQMALETKEEKEKSKLLEFLVTEKKITEDVVAQSNYAKDELLFLQGTWRSQIHNIVNDLPETKEMEIYRQIIEPFQNAILAHLRGLEKKLTFDPQLLDLNEIISVIKEELGSELSRLQGRYKIEFSVDHVESTINGKIRCDPYKVVEILRNLIKNSQKAIELKQIELMKMDISKYRSFKPYISVFMKQNDHMAKLIVTDNGGGLPDEYLDKIFKEPIPSSKKKGYGLGTTFIKFFSERMGFTIKGENVQTEQGKGFRVTLEMPFETVHA